jgi:hypothetical protein
MNRREAQSANTRPKLHWNGSKRDWPERREQEARNFLNREAARVMRERDEREDRAVVTQEGAKAGKRRADRSGVPRAHEAGRRRWLQMRYRGLPGA